MTVVPGCEDLVARLRRASLEMKCQAALIDEAADTISELRVSLLRRGEEIQQYRDKEYMADGTLAPRLRET